MSPRWRNHQTRFFCVRESASLATCTVKKLRLPPLNPKPLHPKPQALQDRRYLIGPLALHNETQDADLGCGWDVFSIIEGGIRYQLHPFINVSRRLREGFSLMQMSDFVLTTCSYGFPCKRQGHILQKPTMITVAPGRLFRPTTTVDKTTTKYAKSVRPLVKTSSSPCPSRTATRRGSRSFRSLLPAGTESGGYGTSQGMGLGSEASGLRTRLDPIRPSKAFTTLCHVTCKQKGVTAWRVH